MGRSVFSQQWHNAAALRPRLLPHARFYPHTYRGKRWYVLQDSAGARYHRLSPAAHALVCRMDGSRTVQQLWDEASLAGGDSIPTQDEVVELLMQLHSGDLLQCDVTPDAAELFERYSKRRKQKWKQWLTNPMSLRIALVNPDRFLARWAPRLAWLFGWRGAALWLATVLPALVLAGQHWKELTGNLSDQVLALDNLVVLVLVFPFVKALHELGHGFATKVWGGTVHEMGLMFLLFAPTPYVDASAASTFRSKRRRALVGAAGMLVEVFVAALAMYLWVLVEPGAVRAVCFNVMLIAGVSTVIVNGNPLLRYDGYYILSDLIEIPNLGQRATRHLTALSDRYLFGARRIEASEETPAEQRWLAFYAVASWCYKVFVTISVILFVAGAWFIFGVLLALWSAIGLFVVPLWKGARHLLESPTLHGRRERAVRLTLGTLALLAVLLGVVPAPLLTRAEGVVWLPDEAMLRAGVDGYVREWLVAPGTRVAPGTAVLQLDDPQLEAELAVARARAREAAARYQAVQFTEPVQADLARQQLAQEERVLARIAERYARLTVHSRSGGVLTVPNAQDMPGRYFKQGEMLGYTLERGALVARVAVAQDNIGLVRSSLRGAELRFADDIRRIWPAAVLREVPGGLAELPSAALGPQGGGTIAVDPGDDKGVKTLERVFYIDLRLPEQAVPGSFGGRVFVRFEHAAEPLAQQWYRRLRQLFLSQFRV
ncbi:biotin/lipoyl-binding protein [Massilia sp. Leaf139]|uniref:biotin/lipoyl-binding protein n=1 Tax=Massilia sp. Leaf139 TaxID=1736272 RepID=UPI0006F3DA38|nr:biotin/lipoyl-binding protein [Massilia sp. Leaf139]KQQ94886.1 peptidase M50 [Massilia sp. Leaf139]